MPAYTVPWSAMLPIFGITVLTIAGERMLNWHMKTFQTEGKPVRFAMDYWDNIMKERDEKLTGSMYRQQTHPFK